MCLNQYSFSLGSPDQIRSEIFRISTLKCQGISNQNVQLSRRQQVHAKTALALTLAEPPVAWTLKASYVGVELVLNSNYCTVKLQSSQCGCTTSVMDDQAGEDDDYSDDDLDALPDHAFHQLQENAIQSTQQPSLSAQVQLPTIEQSTGLAGGLGRLSVRGPASHTANQHAFLAPSSDYGDFDEDMLDGEIFDAAEEPTLSARHEAGAGGKTPGEYSQREQWRVQRYGADQRKSGPIEAQQRVNQQGAVGVPWPDGNHFGDPSATDQGGRVAYSVNQNHTGPPSQGSADVNALQAQVHRVGLLKTHMYRIACLYFCLAARGTWGTSTCYSKRQ